MLDEQMHKLVRKRRSKIRYQVNFFLHIRNYNRDIHWSLEIQEKVYGRFGIVTRNQESHTFSYNFGTFFDKFHVTFLPRNIS